MKYIEDGVQSSIVKYLRLNGYLFTSTGAGLIKNQRTQMIMNKLGYTAGSPDLIVFINNGVVCIECKKPKTYRWSDKSQKMIVDNPQGKQSDEQKEFEAKINKIKGHHYFVATSVADVEDYFKKHNIKGK